MGVRFYPKPDEDIRSDLLRPMLPDGLPDSILDHRTLFYPQPGLSDV